MLCGTDPSTVAVGVGVAFTLNSGHLLPRVIGFRLRAGLGSFDGREERYMRCIAIVTLILIMSAGAFATPPDGVASNEMLAESTLHDALGETVTSADWAVTVAASGNSKVYHQDLVIAPGGYSGWHTHPGVLLVTVEQGSIDWYDSECERRSFEAGDSFTEGSDAHTVVNAGEEDAHMLIAYIVKADEPRRQEAEQPSCGEELNLH
jgi:quercetin dioxygenase-like cupin family protein